MKNTPFYTLIVCTACLVYVLTAFFSSGYYHADEQYQIIEFAGYKLGTHQPHELAWEFRERIRPSLQPVLASGVLATLSGLGIRDVYTQAFVLRLLTALFALFTVHRFVQATLYLVRRRNRSLYAGLSFLLWFLPVLYVRFSSETWSGLTFLLALGMLLSRKKEQNFFGIGALLGLSFLFRFQSAFMSGGLLLWMLFIQRTKWQDLLRTVGGGLAVLLPGLLSDYLFYGTFTCTFWNYFHANIVKDVASEYGVSPWFYYLESIINYPTHFFGICILLAFVTLLVRDPKNVLLWVMVPFIVLHSFIPHKEERFLFPLAGMVPLLLVLAWQQWQGIRLPSLWQKGMRVAGIVIFSILFIVNATGLAAMMLKPAGLGRMKVSAYIQRHYPEQDIHLVFCSWSNPYTPWSLEAKFYRNPQVKATEISTLAELDTLQLKRAPVQLVVARKEDIAYNNGAAALQRNGYTKKMQSVPQWIVCINSRLKLLDNKQVLELYAREPER
ncbi:MAG: hypothetical protein IBJ09_03565 [Bacteroidia bacterium]|nr:hypothetical protein [Bacteroidia bacterium]